MPDRGKDFFHLNNPVSREGVPSGSKTLPPSHFLNHVRDEHPVSYGRWVASLQPFDSVGFPSP